MGYHSSQTKRKSLIINTLITFLFISVFSNTVIAQARESGFGGSPRSAVSKKSSGFQLDRVVMGGSFGAQFGNITLVDLSPTIGYRFTDNLIAGFGVRYIYYEERIFSNTFKTNVYGGNIFSQYSFLENLLAHVEVEALNLEDISVFTRETRRIWINSVFVGGGYQAPIGGNSFVNLLLLFNLTETENSPYSNPILRINFGFGL